MRSCILNSSTCPTTIDFGPQYASNKTAQEILTHVNQCLQFHGRNKIKKFQIFFCPLDEFLTDIENWVAFAVANGVEELKLDFSMGFDYSEEEFTNGGKSFKLPNILFQCKTLTHLSLSHSDFCPPANFSGFDTLCSLSLTYVSITAEKLQNCISNSPSLECLSLKNCKNLESIIVTSKQLRRLNIVNSLWEAGHIEITAPKLESFVYHGTHIFGDLLGYHPYDPFIDISSLSDVFISSIGTEAEHEHDFIKLLYDLRKVKVLTVCTATLMRVTFYEDDEKIPILLQNLKELQLLMEIMSTFELACIYNFFKHCPSPLLENLFIQLPTEPEDPNEVCTVINVVEEPLDVVFSHLRVIKLSNFKGCKSEMRLVKFLLLKALVLESLVLVAPPKSDLMGCMDVEENAWASEAASTQTIEDMTSLRSTLALFPRASPSANILLCEYLEDDKQMMPTHIEYLYEF